MSEETIVTKKGAFVFESVELTRGRGYLNPQQANQNLQELAVVLESAGIKFGIIYGTLLGAIREKGFIPWDEDIDVFMVDEDRELLHSALWDLRSVGLELIRKDGDLYSVMKGNDYIDIYVFRNEGSKRWCNSDVLPEKFFGFTDRVDLLGGSYFCPDKPLDFLEHVYGSDWQTPKQNYPARPWSLWRKFKNILKDLFPKLAQLYFWFREQRNDKHS